MEIGESKRKMKIILLIVPFLALTPNGPELSCGVDNFLIETNETSSR
jgi:hypothetical protein